MRTIFADREPTSGEVERLRLLLSTYQDGTGMLTLKDGRNLPGWRDFERAVAVAFDGVAQENKAIFDVLLPTGVATVYAGISCKMRLSLNDVNRIGRLTIELSNSAQKFWQQLASKQINQLIYRDKPAEVGAALIELVEQWHSVVSINKGGNVDLAKSSYLVLSWNNKGLYQLYRLPLQLPDPSTLRGSFPSKNRLLGEDAGGKVFEWYGESGGQLKYYPPTSWATWQSDKFELEPLSLTAAQFGISFRAASYFPEKWLRANEAE